MRQLYHPYTKWECLPMYEAAGTWQREECLQRYADFLRNTEAFTEALKRVIAEWPISCEQFLSNISINRIAWLGQASMCIVSGIPRAYRAGFMRLSPKEQQMANRTAEQALRHWMRNYGKQSRTVYEELAQLWLPF